jgi:hypothetical protein
MPIELWSRKEGLLRPPPELLHAVEGSTNFPVGFRTRVTYWMCDAFDQFARSRTTTKALYDDLCREYGRSQLFDAGWANTASLQLENHIRFCPDTEVLDLIDAVFQESAYFIRYECRSDLSHTEPARLAQEINRVFSEEGVGYRRVGGRLLRYDGEVTHQEAIVPALQALANGDYGAAEDEFGEAVSDFSRGRWRSSLTHANASFESVLKVLTGESKGTAGDLIKIARKKGLIPGYLGASSETLATLMHGLPAARGQQGSAHGMGPKPVEADERLARLVLVMAAAFIVFLTSDRN